MISVDVFKRPESVDHLRKRVTAITFDEADRVADALGDLPIAVGRRRAWLAETEPRSTSTWVRSSGRAPRTTPSPLPGNSPSPT